MLGCAGELVGHTRQGPPGRCLHGRVPDQDVLASGVRPQGLRVRDPIHVAHPVPHCETPLAFHPDHPPPQHTRKRRGTAQPQSVLPHLGQAVRPVQRVGAWILVIKPCLDQEEENAVVDLRPGPKHFQKASYELPGEHPVAAAAGGIVPFRVRELQSTCTVQGLKARLPVVGAATVDASCSPLPPRVLISAAPSATPALCQPAILAAPADPGLCLVRVGSPVGPRR